MKYTICKHKLISTCYCSLNHTNTNTHPCPNPSTTNEHETRDRCCARCTNAFANLGKKYSSYADDLESLLTLRCRPLELQPILFRFESEKLIRDARLEATRVQ